MTYRDLIVWKKAMDLTEEVYQVTNRFPRHELYGLTNQLRRAAVSIPSNIAEGQGRGSNKEFTRFLNIAHGSLAELETQLLLSVRLGYIKENEIEQIQQTALEVGKMLRGLIRKFQEEKKYGSTTINSPISHLQSSISSRKDN